MMMEEDPPSGRAVVLPRPRSELTYLRMALDDLRDALDAAAETGNTAFKDEISSIVLSVKALLKNEAP